MRDPELERVWAQARPEISRAISKIHRRPIYGWKEPFENEEGLYSGIFGTARADLIRGLDRGEEELVEEIGKKHGLNFKQKENKALKSKIQRFITQELNRGLGNLPHSFHFINTGITTHLVIHFNNFDHGQFSLRYDGPGLEIEFKPEYMSSDQTRPPKLGELWRLDNALKIAIYHLKRERDTPRDAYAAIIRAKKKVKEMMRSMQQKGEK